MSLFSSLGDLFDPVGAAFTGGNNNTFDSIFNPGGNAFGDSGLGITPDFANNAEDTANNFGSNVFDSNIDELKNLRQHLSDDPSQLLTGVDPAATKLWNAALGQNNTPWVDQFGGETNKDFQATANKGINTEDAGYVSQLAHMISATEAGGAIGSLAGNAYGAVTGAGQAAGSSALSDAAGETAGGGFGSSQTAYDASQIPGYVRGAAGAGTLAHAVGNTTQGAALGGANALDNSTNIGQGIWQGGAQNLLGSKLNFAGMAGIDDPLYKDTINGGITGGLKSGMADSSQTGYGALVGALSGLAGRGATAAGNYVNNLFSTSPSSGDGGASGTSNWGNLAAGLGNLWLQHRNATGINGQISSLNSLYAPNSPYAQQMQQALERQDAAGGRRSQYGTRSVELQAALANAASRNAPTLSNLYGQQRQNNFNGLSSLFTTGRNTGLFGGQPQQPQMPSFQQTNPMPSPIQSGQQDFQQLNPGTLDQDVTNTLPDYYGG